MATDAIARLCAVYARLDEALAATAAAEAAAAGAGLIDDGVPLSLRLAREVLGSVRTPFHLPVSAFSYYDDKFKCVTNLTIIHVTMS